MTTPQQLPVPVSCKNLPANAIILKLTDFRQLRQRRAIPKGTEAYRFSSALIDHHCRSRTVAELQKDLYCRVNRYLDLAEDAEILVYVPCYTKEIYQKRKYRGHFIQLSSQKICAESKSEADQAIDEDLIRIANSKTSKILKGQKRKREKRKNRSKKKPARITSDQTSLDNSSTSTLSFRDMDLDDDDDSSDESHDEVEVSCCC